MEPNQKTDLKILNFNININNVPNVKIKINSQFNKVLYLFYKIAILFLV